MNAIEKINAEMQKDADDLYTEILGTYIIDRCGDEAVAALVLADGKTLKGALEAVKAKARKAAKNNVAVLPPGDVFGAVDTYFGIPADTAAQEKALMLAAGGAAPAAPKASGGIGLSFFDFF